MSVVLSKAVVNSNYKTMLRPDRTKKHLTDFLSDIKARVTEVLHQ